MGKFEDRLIMDLMDKHGTSLDEVDRPAPVRRSHRPMWMASGALGVTLAMVGLLTLFGGRGSPAYAVTMGPNGTVTLTVTQIDGIAGANERLRELGLPVLVAAMDDRCHFPARVFTAEGAHDADGRITFAIDQIPAGETLLVGASVPTRLVHDSTSKDEVMLFTALAKGRPPGCGELIPFRRHPVRKPPLEPSSGSTPVKVGG
jgi:hypothetical protein